MDEFFNEGFGGVKLVVEVLGFSHEERVETVDGLEFEVEVLTLLDGCFQIEGDDGVQIPEFPEELKKTLVADFADSDFDAAEVEHHFAEQSLFDDEHDFGLGRGVDDDFFEEGEGVETDVSLSERKATS